MTEVSNVRAFFERDVSIENLYIPTVFAKGPWDPTTLHGRVISGLIAHEAESVIMSGNEADTVDFQVARVTVDLFRVARMKPLRTKFEIIRSGRRIKVIDVSVLIDETNGTVTEIARGTVVFLKKTSEPKGVVWSPPDWDLIPPDDDLHIQESQSSGKYSPVWETIYVGDHSKLIPIKDRLVNENEAIIGQRRVWIRETHDFVFKEEASPIVRLAQVADYANPLANWSTEGLQYINADISLYVHRVPVGKWIGAEASYHGSQNGISVGSISLYDKLGKIGTSTVTGLSQMRTVPESK